jgi:hypothetical protein
MDADDSASTNIFDLPDHCLLAVMQLLVDNPVSLFSAAHAHSWLHQVAAVVLDRISTKDATQDKVNSMLPYLDKYGEAVHHLSLTNLGWTPTPTGHRYGRGASKVSLRELPSTLYLSSLELVDCQVQLQPGNVFQGLVQPECRSSSCSSRTAH